MENKMSDRPTPEADDQPIIYAINDNGYQVPCVDIDFARKLERERDEAREALRHIEEYGTEEINTAVSLRQKLASALVELDEAREDRDMALRNALDSDHAYNRMVKVVEKAYSERDKAREALMRIEEIFVDGDDTYEDWKEMGSIARSALEAAK